MRIPRFRMRVRIFLGFGVLIVLLVGIAAYGGFGLSVVGDEIDVMDGIAGNMNRLNELALRMETIRRGLAEDPEAETNADTLKEVTEAEARAAALLKESAEFTLSDQRRDMFNGLAARLRAVGEKQQQFVASRDASAPARARLFAAETTLNEAVARHMAAIGGDTPEPARMTEFRLRLLRAEAAGARALASSADVSLVPAFRKALAAANEVWPADGGTAAAVVASLESYVRAFDAVTGAEVEGITLYDKTMRPELRDLQVQTGKLLGRLITGFNSTSQKAYNISSDTLTRQIGLSAGAAVIGIVLALLIGRGIVRPLAAMTGAMRRLSEGDHDTAIPARDNTDEIGDMARAVEVFRQNAIERERLAEEQAASRATRERRQSAMDRHTQDFGKSVSGVMEALAQSAAGMRQAAEAMAQAAGAVHTEALGTAGGAEKSSRDLMNVAAAVEEFTASLEEIARQVAAAAAVSRKAVQRADESRGTMRGLADATARIGDVVQLINVIAGQTNLLALNATIEAARAGEAGRGFAVVAGEVKQLAAQTARATADIGGQIETVRAATADAVAAMTEIGDIISQMDQVSAAISSAVEQQNTTTREIAASVQAVSSATADTAQAMQHVVTVADNAGGNSRDVLAGAAAIGQEAVTLRSEVDQFLNAVRADAPEDRRRYERFAVQGAMARLRADGRPEVQAPVRDISRGGVSFGSDWTLPAGTSLEVDLPEAGGPVPARVVWSGKGELAVVFSSEPAALARIDRALASLVSRRDAA